MNFKEKITQFKQKNLYRQILINDAKLIDFCSNDYLGMKSHSKVIESFKNALDKYGVGSGGSHLISGHSLPHLELEEYLASLLNCQKVLIFSTGYMANLGVFSALKDDLNWILQDKLNHASLLDANFLISQKIQRYKHNDIDSLQQKINKQSGFGLIATDNIFSMDGDIANITTISDTIKDYNAILMQDDAHGFGIYKPNIPKNSIYMATFGKAIGTFGAFVAGDADFIDYLIQKSRPYIYTTATPPALSVATLTALKIIDTEKPQQKLFENIRLFKSLVETNSNTAIQPILIDNNEKALQLSNDLLKKGFLVKAIRPPTVKKAILRVTLSANHTNQQIEKLAESLIL